MTILKSRVFLAPAPRCREPLLLSTEDSSPRSPVSSGGRATGAPAARWARGHGAASLSAEMGNQLAAPARVQPGELLATDVPNLVFKDSLGGGRFLKTFLTRHEEGQRGGLVVVKVYLKRGAPGTGGGLDPALVKEHERRLRRLRHALCIVLVGCKHRTNALAREEC